MVMTNPAHAAQRSTPIIYTADGQACVHSPHGSYPTPLVCIRRTNSTNTVAKSTVAIASAQISTHDPAKLEFSEEESSAAISLFGCDCPACVSALRNLRGLPGLPL
ncbi:hypothetical protein Cal7507_4436 [Calothrix sp. PCC 7507]|nr:hypothetical protein Cal7507_4436 [Calothrix sp. PCC 7507]